MYQQWTNQKWNQEKNPFHDSIKMNKMLRNKFSKRPEHWKLESIAKVRKSEASGKTFHARGLEDSTLTGGDYPPNDRRVQCDLCLNPSMHSDRNWQAVPKTYLECKGPEIAKTILKSKCRILCTWFSDLLKRCSVGNSSVKIDVDINAAELRGRIKNKTPHIYGQFIFNKGAQAGQCGKR